MTNQKTKSKSQKVTASFFEQVGELAGGIGRSVKKDLIQDGIKDTVSQVLGKRGELKQGETIDLAKEKREIQRPRFFEIRRKETVLFLASEEQLMREVEEARRELRQAVKELEKLGQEVKEAEKEVDRMPVKPGIYHLTFFERLKQIIKFFRERIEESRSWLALMTSKKKKRSYWVLYKKHGTKFGLSGERAVATQAE